MHIIAEGRLMGFDAGDWSLLFAGALMGAALLHTEQSHAATVQF